MIRSLFRLTLVPCLMVTLAEAAMPPTSVPVDQTLTQVFELGGISGATSVEKPIENFRMQLKYDSSTVSKLQLRGDHAVSLPPGNDRRVEVCYEQAKGRPAHLRVWVDGKLVEEGRDLEGTEGVETTMVAGPERSNEILRLDRSYTAMVAFRAGKNGGALLAKANSSEKRRRGQKVLSLTGNKLLFEAEPNRSLKGTSSIQPGSNHIAILVSEDGNLSLYLDGKLEATGKGLTDADPKGGRFMVGLAPSSGKEAVAFDGLISGVRYWERALEKQEIAQLSNGRIKAVNTPDFDWSPELEDAETISIVTAIKPVLEPGKGFVLKQADVQPLSVSDHAEIVSQWNDESLARGEAIYNQLCVTCHGTVATPGSLPTAPRFHLGQFNNGADPYRMFQTLEKGYGQMVAQPQYTTSQKYDVIHYLREEFLRGHNKGQLVEVDDDYLAMLPRGMSREEEKEVKQKLPQYLLQDFGDVLFWTLQVEAGNIAQKGIAVRVDEGPGGISKGKAWMLYEHDTMRLAACWTGDRFVDWRGIAFDGSHGTHTSIVGDLQFKFPNEPMWADPNTGQFNDTRILGRDGLPYGPLPDDWVSFSGLAMHGQNPVIHYRIGDCDIMEIPELAADGAFVRKLFCGPSTTALKLKLTEKDIHEQPASESPFQFAIRYDDGKVSVDTSLAADARPAAPQSSRFEGRVTTAIIKGEAQGAWAVDVLEPPAPDDNPWQSWMRTSGFDFFDGGKSAAVCTWNGDVWIVDGIDQPEGELQWQRICSGLFQPLGVKVINGEIYVGCRDMIAILRDRNGDRETDYIESFNSDHQVTEHFHEFAMGLQADDQGNLYYAKSARHAKKPVVPHHGTLLKVSRDGRSTEILATGFRAANGVCINPDGSFMVTDQEGHWNPKNRINWVKGRGKDDFYGNMWGYHSITDESDEAMNQPLCWITNRFDRSPAELLWVPEDSAWEPLRGSLLNLSYGAGRIYTVPFEKIGEEVQGGMAAFPIDLFPTGVMRGRFSPKDGQLYGCGMFAWAGNRQQPGGFYRVRYTGQPAHQPIGLSTDPGKVMIEFSDPLDEASAEDPGGWVVKAWDLERTPRYGSKHFNEKTLEVSEVKLSDDGLTATLSIPSLAPTWGMSINMKLRGSNGESVEREIHNSIFELK